MPRLPTDQDLGRRPTPRPAGRTTQFAPYGVEDALAGAESGLTGLGEMIREAGERRQERQDTALYGAAQSSLLQADLELQRQLREDGDYSTWMERYKKSMEERAGSLSETIPSPRLRAAFMQDAMTMRLRGEETMRSLAWGRESDEGVARLNETLEVNMETALQATDSEAINATAAATATVIQGALENRYIDETDAQRLRRGWYEDFAARRLEMMTPQDRLDAIDEADPWLARMPVDWITSQRQDAADDLERQQEEARREADRREREWLVRADRYIQTLNAGAQVSPVISAQFSDEAIDANVNDPEMRMLIRAERDLAMQTQQDVSVLATLPASEMGGYIQTTATDTSAAPAITLVGAEVQAAEIQRSQALIRASNDILEERALDPAGAVIRHNPSAGNHWQAFMAEPTQDTWLAWRTAAGQVFEQQQYGQQRLLPVQFAENLSGEVNNAWGTDPETAAAQLTSILNAVGDEDRARVVAELEAGGLAPEAAGIAFVMDSPTVQTQLINIARNGGTSALRDAVDSGNRTTIEDELQQQFRDAATVAGGANGRFLKDMQTTALALALDRARGDTSPTDAARWATRQVLESNFQVINGGSVQGMIPADARLDEVGLDRGGRVWMHNYLHYAGEDRSVVQLLDGSWATVPEYMADLAPAAQDFSELPLMSSDERDRFQSFESEDAARSAQEGRNLLRFHESMLRDIPFQEGTRDEDRQGLARDIVRNRGRFMLSPDGRRAHLVIDIDHVPIEVIGADGNAVVIPVDQLMHLGQVGHGDYSMEGPGVERDPGVLGR